MPPPLRAQPSSSMLDTGAQPTATASSSSSSLLRPAVLLKIQSRLPALLKSLHSLALSLPKSKRLRTLLSDLVEELLRPLLKLGASPHELMFFLRVVRETATFMPSFAHMRIEREAIYPHAYERRERAEAAAEAARAESQQQLDEAERTSRAAATLAPAPTPVRRPSLFSITATAASFPAASSADPLRRALVNWCRWLDAVAPCCVILYINLGRAQETQ